MYRLYLNDGVVSSVLKSTEDSLHFKNINSSTHTKKKQNNSNNKTTAATKHKANAIWNFLQEAKGYLCLLTDKTGKRRLTLARTCPVLLKVYEQNSRTCCLK